MSQKKEDVKSNKPGVKIQDLSPKKDAKGGRGFSENKVGVSQNKVSNNQNSVQSNTVNRGGLD